MKNTLYIKNARMFNGDNFLRDKNILISDGKIVDLISHRKNISAEREIDAAGLIVTPGFIDIQVNGGGGAFFNEDQSVKCISKIMKTHLRYGTTSLLPTFITDKKRKTQRAISVIQESILKNIPGILGIHLEGPYINYDKKGIHISKYIRSFENDEISSILNSYLGIILMTLAPEKIEQKMLKKMVEKNAVIFAGHSNATYKEMMNFFISGGTGVTHLFNACSPLGSREAGVVGAALSHENSWCSVIADGFHVCFETLNIAFKVKNKQKFILVSDAMPTAGTKLKSFFINDKKIFVKNGRCVSADGTLAGSHTTLYEGFCNLIKSQIVSLDEALKMTSTNAAECLGIDRENKLPFKKGRILPNYDADLVIFDEKSLKISYVIQNGGGLK